MGEMDSGNSGSIQSSSTGGAGGGGGDDQELDSRGEPMSNFFSPTPFQLYSLNNGSLSFDQHQVPSYNFDPTTFSQSSPGNFIINNVTNTTNKNSNDSSNNLDMVWPNKFGSIRPTIISSHDANCTTPPYGFSLNNFNHTSTPTPDEVSLHQQRPPPLPLPTTRAPSVSAESSPRTSDHQGGGGGSGGAGRNPKKRSRASRRAPTTVLTTDTTNFRQMVQEFTGIPAPPFSAAGAFPSRTRLDLFGGLGIQLPRTGSVGVGGAHSVGLDMSNSPPYLLRPFPQKVLPHQLIPTPVQPFCLGSSAPSSLPGGAILGASTSSMSSTVNPFSATTTGSFEVRPQNVMMSTQGSMQTLQALLQQDSSMSNVKSNTGDTLIMREYGMSHATTTTMTTSTTPVTSLGVQNWSALNRTSFNGIDASTGVAAAVNEVPSGNNGGVSRGEGMVDSWICSSD